MKIRADFVTNSSSSSYITATIDSPVLADILRRLKEQLEDLPLPDGPEKDRIMEDYRYSGLHTFIRVQGPDDSIVSLDADTGGGLRFEVPRSVRGLGPAVYRTIVMYAGSEDFFERAGIDVIEELNSRSEEIADSTVRVSWDCGASNWGEFKGGRPSSRSFSFNRDELPTRGCKKGTVVGKKGKRPPRPWTIAAIKELWKCGKYGSGIQITRYLGNERVAIAPRLLGSTKVVRIVISNDTTIEHLIAPDTANLSISRMMVVHALPGSPAEIWARTHPESVAFEALEYDPSVPDGYIKAAEALKAELDASIGEG